jgi:geranylgeranyl pyrophosphate synthase
MIEAMKKSPLLLEIIEKCNERVRQVLQASTIEEAAIALESFSNGGKRLRPALMLLSSSLPTRKPITELDDAFVELASAIELIHLATLFHDDVIDEVDKRRHNASARAKYGNHASVLAGDFALAEALELVQHSSLSHTMPEFLRTIRVLIRGESLETRHKFDFDMNDAVYFEIISEKSASLFALSCKVGALSQNSRFADTLGHLGWNLGMAFQMIDDIDDMLAHPNHSMDCDLKNGYIALPIIRVLSSLEDGHKAELTSIIRNGTFTLDHEKIIASLCSDLGAIQQTQIEIRTRLDHARQTLLRFTKGESRDLFASIINDLKAYSEAQVRNYAEFSRS